MQKRLEPVYKSLKSPNIPLCLLHCAITVTSELSRHIRFTVYALNIGIPQTLNLLIRPFDYPFMSVKTVRRVANSVDPDQTRHPAASDLGLHCFPRLSDFLWKIRYPDTGNLDKCAR